MPKIRNSWGLFLNQRNVHKYSQQLIQQQLCAEDSQVHPCALVIQWTQRVGFALTHSLTSKTSAYFLNFSLIGSLKYKTPPKTIHRTWPIIHDQLAPWPQEQEFFFPSTSYMDIVKPASTVIQHPNKHRLSFKILHAWKRWLLLAGAVRGGGANSVIILALLACQEGAAR